MFFGPIIMFSILYVTVLILHAYPDRFGIYGSMDQSPAQKAYENISYLPLWKKVALYGNDISPISVHNYTNPFHYTYPKAGHYKAKKLFNINKNWALLLKVPHLGISTETGVAVGDSFVLRFFNSLLLLSLSLDFTVFLGIALGAALALRRLSGLTLLGNFRNIGSQLFIGLVCSNLLAYVAYHYLGLYYAPGYRIVDPFQGVVFQWFNLIGPGLLVAFGSMVLVALFTFAYMRQEYRQTYIIRLQSMGVNPYRIHFKHALPNALSYVSNDFPVWLLCLLISDCFIEYFLSWNGLGKWLIEGLLQQDVAVVISCAAVFILLWIGGVILSQFCSFMIDPKATQRIYSKKYSSAVA